MDLPSFISQIGNAEAAKLFNVTPRAVMAWRYGTRRPRPEKAWEIERATKGKVRFVDIYQESRP